MATENPKVFVSYSWSSPDHEAWVIRMCKELADNGIHVELDRWALKEGHDTLAFMERMVNDPTINKVVIVSDRAYAEKANSRSKGVGTETQIITPEIYGNAQQTKFVVVVPEMDEHGRPFLPTYYKSRLYIDLSSAERYAAGMEQLVRWVWDKPIFERPEVGPPPSFVTQSSHETLGTSAAYRRSMAAIVDSRPNSGVLASDYLRLVSTNLERFRITDGPGEFDERFVSNIQAFTPYRDEVLGVIRELARHFPTPSTWTIVHSFFESLIHYFYPPKTETHYRREDFDNFKFITQELFLHTIALLLRERCFSAVDILCSKSYYAPNNRSADGALVPFTVFRHYLPTFENRNQRLDLRRLSLVADTLKERCPATSPFDELMQADFVLYLRDSLTCMTEQRRAWFPDTLVFAETRYGAFEMFARSASKEYLGTFDVALGQNFKSRVEKLIAAWKAGTIQVPHWQHYSFSPIHLMGYDSLGTLR